MVISWEIDLILWELSGDFSWDPMEKCGNLRNHRDLMAVDGDSSGLRQPKHTKSQRRWTVN